jgi:Predicted rRNA methylase (SpoU class)
MSITVTLFEPQIPQNTGNIARLCAATNVMLHLVGEIGFSLSDKYLKRAGLDYWPHVKYKYFPSIEDYLFHCDMEAVHLFTTKSNTPYTNHHFHVSDTIIFGSETQGISDTILNQFPERCCTLPMANPHIRSLNLSTTVGIAVYEALRQLDKL